LKQTAGGNCDPADNENVHKYRATAGVTFLKGPTSEKNTMLQQ
jgi:hypothetical protein